MTRDSVKRECETFLWQRLTRVIVGWVAFRTLKNKWCVLTAKLLWMTPAGCKPMPLTKLHDKPATCYITAVTSPTNCECSLCGFVITCAVQMCGGTTVESRNFASNSVSIVICVFPNSGVTCSQHCATYCVHIMHILRQPIHCGTSIYVGGTLYGSLLFWTVYVWVEVNVEVWLVVILVSVLSQWAVGSPVNVSVKGGYFPVL